MATETHAEPRCSQPLPQPLPLWCSLPLPSRCSQPLPQPLPSRLPLVIVEDTEPRGGSMWYSGHTLKAGRPSAAAPLHLLARSPVSTLTQTAIFKVNKYVNICLSPFESLPKLIEYAA